MAKGKSKRTKKAGKSGKSSNARKAKTRRTRKQPILIGDESGDLETQLRRLQLTIKDMTGDGNCLFRALSDQYYGSDGKHRSIRKEVCEFLREHEDEYKFFVEDDQTFEHHVSCMEDDGTYGGNMELASFARLRGVDIKVYQPGMIYCITAQEEGEEESDHEEEKQTLHIAYHSWEHYSSVRNLEGPFTGPPEIKEIDPEESGCTSEGSDSESEPNSIEKVVLNAYPSADLKNVRRLLKKHKGNANKAIDALYEMNEDDTNIEKNGAIEDATEEMPTALEQIDEEQLSLPQGTSEMIDEFNKDKDVKCNAQTIESEIEENTHKDDSDEEEEEKAVESIKAKPAKRLTSRERRLEARVKRKENQRLKKSGSKKPSTIMAEEDTVTPAMRQLYI